MKIKKQKETIDFSTMQSMYRMRNLETCKIPYKKWVIAICAGILILSIATPFTNWLLFPLSFKIFRRFA